MSSIDKALKLELPHISSYSLIVEPKTVFYNLLQKDKLYLPTQDTEAEMYERLMDTMEHHGLRQYEISNFALPAFPCRHNLDCWRRKEYIGIGSAACGFMGNVRWQNPPALQDYLAGMPSEETVISPEEARFESMMRGLRTMEGVSEKDFLAMHGVSLEKAFGRQLKKPLQEGLIKWENGRVFLTETGLSLQNRILVELL